MTRKRVERGIYLQANGTYGVYLLVGGRRRFKTVGRKLAEARRVRGQLQASADRGELPAPTRLTFAQLAASWIEGFEALVEAGERGERTLENYRYYLDGHLLPALGRRRLQEITTDDIAQLLNQLRAKGLSAKTISGALTPLNRILNHAVRRGHISDNPVRRLEQHERPRIHRRDQRVLDHGQISQLLDASRPRYQPVLATGLYTGMRLNELLGLTWQEIDFDASVIHVRHQLSRPTLDRPARRVRLKTAAATRDIPLLPQLAVLLKRHRLAARHTAANDYVFETATGTPLGARNIERRGLGHAPDTAGLDHDDQLRLRVHDLRHTFASHLIIDLKLDIVQASRILGHARPSITLDTYTHLFNHTGHADDIRQRMAESDFGNLLADRPAASRPARRLRLIRETP
jgi:integrase